MYACMYAFMYACVNDARRLYLEVVCAYVHVGRRAGITVVCKYVVKGG